MPKPASTFLSRLLGEFLVIVVGVLVALGVDRWAGDRTDRMLEREYLERLSDDADYDITETTFVAELGRAGSASVDSLLDSTFVRTAEPQRFVAAILLASNQRVPDLSRSTFRELVSSGRIGLIRSRDVRSALAEYDRVVTEFEGFWEPPETPFGDWTLSSVPARISVSFNATCGSEQPSRGQALRSCPFSLEGWSPDDLRRSLLQPATRALLTRQGYRTQFGPMLAERIRESAERLKGIVDEELRRGGAL